MSVRQDLEMYLWKDRAEKAEALLKRVFGKSCIAGDDVCACTSYSDRDYADYCNFKGLHGLEENECAKEGRRPDCPYLPFEEK
jgi:hypothetical protein